MNDIIMICLFLGYYLATLEASTQLILNLAESYEQSKVSQTSNGSRNQKHENAKNSEITEDMINEYKYIGMNF